MEIPASQIAMTNARTHASSHPAYLKADALELRRRAEDLLGVPEELHPYQWEGVAFLCRSPAALLADEMGLGKTVQASVALSLLLDGQKGMERALIVAPAALTRNWMSELEKWAPSLTVRRVQGNEREREAFYLLPIPVLVSSYEQIRQDGLYRIPSDTFDIVVLDEAQRVKNRNSGTALACRTLPRKSAWALSATPLENSSEDVAAILGFLDPSIRQDMTVPSLKAKLESMMLRRRKADVRGELPPVIVQDMELDLTPPQRERYDEMWVNRWTEAGADTVQSAAAVLLGLVTRLKTICNLDVDTGASSKFDALREICEGAGPRARILVFSQFVETLKWISDRLTLPHDVLTGTMSGDQRQDAVRRFRTEPAPRVLLVSIRAGGVGLNMGEATHVVVFDRWWNPAVEIQAVYRAHRFTRDEPLHVVRFLITDSIEERIADVLDRKKRMFENVVEDIETSAQHFSVEELIRILELSRADVYSMARETAEDRLHGEDC